MNIRIVLFFLSASSLSHLAYAQQGQWTWMSGPNLFGVTTFLWGEGGFKVPSK